MQNKLRIAFRKKQLYFQNDISHPIIIECDIDGNPIYVDGTIADNNFIDMTAFTEGLEKLNLTWDGLDTNSQSSQSSQSEGANNGSSDIGSNYNEGITLQLRFTGPAFQFIYDWMMTTVCQILNSIEVRVTDVDCNRDFRLFEIKLDNITYRPFDEPCIVETSLVERDDVIQSFQTSIIEDNWQGWFNTDGTSAKDHPAFMYVVEKKPNFILVALVVVIYLAGILSTGILLAFDSGREWIRKTLGVCYFCPSPLIRTYIENICAKFGYTFDTIFDDLPGNPYRNCCIFYPVTKSESNFSSFDATNNKFYWDNRIGIAFNVFLDQLKLLFNAEWYCTPEKKLVFKPKSYFENLAPLYDFTAPGAYKLYNYITSFNGNKKPAYGQYQYATDPQDSCCDDLKWRYNTIADFTNQVFNPMLEGNISKNFNFSKTAFMVDYSATDFLKDAITLGRVIALGAILVGLGELFTIADPFTVVAVIALLTVGYTVTNAYVNDFFDNAIINGAVRTSYNNINIPRVLLWDGESMTRAKVVSASSPAQNPLYNSAGTDYEVQHPTIDGSPFPTGSPIYNYPMYFDEQFTENMFDRFHEIDNPLHSPIINQTWDADIDLCCSVGDTFGFWDGDFIKIGAVVVLENRNGRLIKGRITDIKPDYEKGTVHLKGSILK